MKRLKAWWAAVFPTPTAPAQSEPHHSSRLIWDEEAFYGMAERLFGDKDA